MLKIGNITFEFFQESVFYNPKMRHEGVGSNRVHTKPTSRADKVVVDIDFSRPGCSDAWGWIIRVDPEYPIYLAKYLPEAEFEVFVKEANEALSLSKLETGGVALNTLCCLTCCVGLICVKGSVDKATMKAVQSLRDVARKWNKKFASEGRLLKMSVVHWRTRLHRSQIRTDGTLGGVIDNHDRITELDDEAWIEIDIVKD